MIKTRSVLATSTAALALLASPAYAQDAFEDEIIVTATKRQTTLQDTPVAVTVTSADVIEKAQILDIKDLQSVVPTFRVSQLQNSANTTLTIRGFGNGGNNIGIEPSVGLFVDGVYRSRAAAQIVDLPNLDRVEVLAGPQSTLFGKNASAGVVSVVTSEPQFDTEGYIEGGLGNYSQYYVRGYATTGISENIAVSLGGGYQQRDGYFDPVPGTVGEFNDLDRFNIRGQLLWTPSDTGSIRLIADYNQIDENCCGTTTAFTGPTVPIIQALGGTLPGLNDPFNYTTAANRPTTNEIGDGGVSLTVENDFDWLGGVNFTSITAYRQNGTDYTSDSDFTSLELLEDTFQFVDIDTFTQEFRLASTDGEYFNWLFGAFIFDEKIDQDSGLDYGSDLRNYIDALASGGASLVGGPAASPLAGVEAGLGFAPGTFFNDNVRIEETFEQDNTAFSLFANFDAELTDRFTLSLGGSYNEDKKSVSASTVNNDIFSGLSLTGEQGTQLISGGLFLNGDAASGTPSFQQALGLPFSPANLQSALSGAFGPAAQGYVNAVIGASAALAADEVNGPLAGLLPLQFQPQFLSFPNAVEDGETKDDDFTYTIKGAYEFNDNFNGYVSNSTGFKSSSWNLTRDSRPFLADATALSTAGLLPINYTPATGRNFGTRFAGPEKATVWEAGLKARFEWGAFNVAVFDQTIEGFQSTIFQGTGFVLANAGEQSTRGIEFDSTFTPVDGLRLGIAGIIQDPQYDDYQGAPVIQGSPEDQAFGLPNDGIGDLSGAQPAGINEVSLSFSGQYDFDLTDTVAAFVRADYQYEDEIQVVDNIPGLLRDTSIVNAAFGFEMENGLAVRFWGRNLFDHETFTSGFPGVVQSGTVSSYPNQPRTYGVSLRKNF